MDDMKLPIYIFISAFMIVAAVTVLMHEKHYQSRKQRILEAKVRILEEIITEERNS